MPANRSASAYDLELASLPQIYDRARTPSPNLEAALTAIRSLPTRFVGSGGALAVAQLAADLHKFATHAAGWATTPLLSIHEPVSVYSGFVLISSRAKNPDTAVALSAARARGHRPLVMLSQRTLSEMPERVRRHHPLVVTIDSPPDGFLATGSTVSMSTALVAAHGHSVPIADDLFPRAHAAPIMRERLLILYSWGLEGVARDIEARVSELGLAPVQLSDYRNFAHGRHVGLSRNMESTTVLALADPNSQAIADSTLRQLPEKSNIVLWHSEHSWPISALDLLVRSCHLPTLMTDDDPAKPKVPIFGRRLYNLPIARILRTDHIGPVQRKLAAGLYLNQPTHTANALSNWLQYSTQQSVRAIVLDYDGTCCFTDERFQSPRSTVQAAILQVLDLGLNIAFASGRGKSLLADLRKWIPREYWSVIRVGMYNGAVEVPLDGQLSDQSTLSTPFNELAKSLRAEFTDRATVEARTSQLTIESACGNPGRDMLPTIRAVLARHGSTYKAFASGHSVDVVRQTTSKTSLVSALQSPPSDSSSVLAIGDSGDEEGNDFELLAASQLSLSVDRVSADLTRCWNLDSRGESGPVLLVRYLTHLNRMGNTIRFKWEYP